jgi:nucleotide-binding universal stress UspA family protein
VTSPVLLCADGSPRSLAALRSGLALLGSHVDPVVVTVVQEPDLMAVTGTGFASGVISSDEFDREVAMAHEGGAQVVAEVQRELGLEGSASHVLTGQAGPAICELATALGATAIVLGTRGHGGLRRAVLGSVSDHVVRHAPCTVVVTGPEADDA